MVAPAARPRGVEAVHGPHTLKVTLLWLVGVRPVCGRRSGPAVHVWAGPAPGSWCRPQVVRGQTNPPHADSPTKTNTPRRLTSVVLRVLLSGLCFGLFACCSAPSACLFGRFGETDFP